MYNKRIKQLQVLERYSSILWVIFYRQGHGVEQNEEEAIKLFKMSAEQVITGFKYSSIRTELIIRHFCFHLPNRWRTVSPCKS